MTLDRLHEILENAGFRDIDIDSEFVSDEYASKWGLDTELNLKHYLRNSTITAYK